MLDSNIILISPEQPSLVLFRTHGIMYMADSNRFGGDVKVVLKGNTQPFVMQQNYAFSEESRGIGVAEIAWSMRKGQKNRANRRWSTTRWRFYT